MMMVEVESCGVSVFLDFLKVLKFRDCGVLGVVGFVDLCFGGRVLCVEVAIHY